MAFDFLSGLSDILGKKKKPSPLALVAAGGGEGGDAPRYPMDERIPRQPEPFDFMKKGNSEAPIDATGGVDDALSSNAAAKKRGLFSGIGDALKDPTTRAALFRSGAATIDGGLGAGAKAAAGYMDDKRDYDEKKRQWELGHQLDETRVGIEQQRADDSRQGIDDNYNINRGQLAETTEHHRGSRRLEQNRIISGDRQNVRDNSTRRYGIDVGDANDDADRTYRYDDLDFRRYDSAAERADRQAQREAQYGRPGYVRRKRVFDAIPEGTDKPGWFTGSYDAQPKVEEEGDFPLPPQSAIDALKGNPRLQVEFDRKYGPGASAEYLGQR